MIVMFNPVEYVKRKTKAIIHKQCYHENQRTQSILSFLSPPSIVKKNIICSRMIHHKLKTTEVQIFNTMVIIVKKRKLSTIPIAISGVYAYRLYLNISHNQDFFFLFADSKLSMAITFHTIIKGQ